MHTPLVLETAVTATAAVMAGWVVEEVPAAKETVPSPHVGYAAGIASRVTTASPKDRRQPIYTGAGKAPLQAVNNFVGC